MLASTIALVQCGAILTPAIDKLVSEKVIESHGSNVVHASAPLATAVPLASTYLSLTSSFQPLAEIVRPVTKSSSSATGKTTGALDQTVHVDAVPLPAAESPHVAIATLAVDQPVYAGPIYHPYLHQLIAERTVANYGHSVRHVAA